MTTLNKIIYTLRNLRYGGLQADDYSLSDRQLAHLINAERALLVKQDLDKKRALHDAVIQDLGCVKLECVDSAECCEDYITEEFVHRTVELIPTPLNLHNPIFGPANTFAFVGLVDGFTPIEMTSPQIAGWSRYRRFTAKDKRAFYKNNRIYVFNAGDLDVINVRGVFEDPVEVEKFTDCGGNSCFSFDSPYPLSSYLESILIQSVFAKFVQLTANTNLIDENNDGKDAPETTNTR